MASSTLSSAQLSRLNALKEKRDRLKSKIRDARSAVSFDTMYIRSLQKENLFLKDEIFTIEKRAVSN